MDYDLFLVIGIFLGVLAIPSLLSAFSESRAPRTAAIMVLISGVLIALALTQKTGGYAIDDIPDTIMQVIRRYLG